MHNLLGGVVAIGNGKIERVTVTCNMYHVTSRYASVARAVGVAIHGQLYVLGQCLVGLERKFIRTSFAVGFKCIDRPVPTTVGRNGLNAVRWFLNYLVWFGYGVAALYTHIGRTYSVTVIPARFQHHVIAALRTGRRRHLGYPRGRCAGLVGDAAYGPARIVLCGDGYGYSAALCSEHVAFLRGE